jgi:Heparinase II/III-like protein/Alginate lyase
VHRKRALAAALVVAAPVAVAVPLSSSATTVEPHRFAPATLEPELRALQATTAVEDTGKHCGTAAPNPVPDGVPIVVSIPPGPSFTVGKIPTSWWRTPPYGDSGWQLQLRGFIYVSPLAQRAYQDGQQESLKALVDQVVAFHAENPDPNTNDAGWDEGSALRRLGAENCLYSLTKDARLVKGMEADVAVQYGWRFYGPPYKAAVHNHGVMADHAVIRAAALLGRKDWLDRSLNRLQAAAPGAWTPQGVNREQSSSYHVFNTVLWGWIAGDFDEFRGAGNPGSKLIQGLVTKAKAVSSWLTEPDGKLNVYGDATAEPGYPNPSRTARTFQDNNAGLAIGRWSWKDSRTSYYVLRYGPKRWGHGQQDRVGVTWSTQGLRILVNPGRALYDSQNVYRTYAASAGSHNVAVPDKRAIDTAAGAKLVSTVQKAAWHTWNFTDMLYGVRHDRQLSVLRDLRRLVCTDTVSGRVFRQYWHLDPAWSYVGRSTSGHTMWFTAGGHKLKVSSSAVLTRFRRSTSPVAGWHFPTASTAVGASEVQVKATSTAKTIFTVD